MPVDLNHLPPSLAAWLAAHAAAWPGPADDAVRRTLLATDFVAETVARQSRDLAQAAKSANFSPKAPVLEVSGLCARCREGGARRKAS